jgi:hypothetical protein
MVSSSSRIGWFLALVLIFSVVGFSQSKQQYQSGAVIKVKAHPVASDREAKKYDVSIKVGNQIYVVLFTPLGSTLVEYKEGLETTVLVDGKNMKVNDITGKTWTLPIISRKEINEKKEGK